MRGWGREKGEGGSEGAWEEHASECLERLLVLRVMLRQAEGDSVAGWDHVVLDNGMWVEEIYAHSIKRESLVLPSCWWEWWQLEQLRKPWGEDSGASVSLGPWITMEQSHPLAWSAHLRTAAWEIETLLYPLSHWINIDAFVTAT